MRKRLFDGNYCFSAKAFLMDMNRDPTEDDWIFKCNGKRIVEHKTYDTSSFQKITLGIIENTNIWVFQEWCEKVN